MVEFLEPSWDEIEEMCRELCKKIKKEFEPEIIIAIIRGGMIPGRLFSDYLGNNNVATVKTEHYIGIGKTMKKPVITQPLTVDIKGKKVLLVDDVSDSGKSLKEVVKYLKEKNPEEIKVATLHYKPGSVYKPNYFIGTTDKWIIYPWEKEEMRKERLK